MLISATVVSWSLPACSRRSGSGFRVQSQGVATGKSFETVSVDAIRRRNGGVDVSTVPCTENES